MDPWMERNLRNASLCYPNIKFESSGLIRGCVRRGIVSHRIYSEFKSRQTKRRGVRKNTTRRRGYRKLQRSTLRTHSRVPPVYTLFSRAGNRGLKYRDPTPLVPTSIDVCGASPREHNLRKLGFPSGAARHSGIRASTRNTQDRAP